MCQLSTSLSLCCLEITPLYYSSFSLTYILWLLKKNQHKTKHYSFMKIFQQIYTNSTFVLKVQVALKKAKYKDVWYLFVKSL